MIDAARGLLDLLLAALWQDACIVLVAGALLGFAGARLNACTRYAVLQGILLSLIAVPLLTTYSSAARAPVYERILIVQELGGPAAVTVREKSPAVVRPVRVPSSDAIVLVLAGTWLLGALAFAARLGAGVLQLSRLVRRSERLPDRDGVRMFSSRDVSVPLAFGLLRPSVVVPSELAARGAEELECVLLHELAHVRRGDAWANVYERLVHALLFFNPAVVIVLRAIALEREAACDDWAVMRSHDAGAYLHALASFALRRAHDRALVACGVAGFGHATMARLRRLEDPRRNGAVTVTRSSLGGFIAVLFVLALGLDMFGPSIALAGQRPGDGIAVASDPCPKRVMGPPPVPLSVPAGMRAEVQVRVTPDGVVQTPTVVASSGNPAFDRLTTTDARLLMVAAGKVTPPRCSAPVSGTYRIALETGAPHPKTSSRFTRWTIRNDRWKKPVVIGSLSAPGRNAR